MRCALLGPTPGSALRASMRRVSCGECRMSKGQLHSRRQLPPRHRTRHFLLHARLHTMDRVVHRRRDEILQQLAIIARHRRFDLYFLHLMAPAHGHLHHAAARLTDDLDARNLRLRLLDVVLQRLRLLHEIAHIATHVIALRFAYLIGLTVSVKSVAPKRSRSACTPGSASSDSRAAVSCASEACSSARAGDSASGTLVSNSRRTVSPKERDNAWASLSCSAGVLTNGRAGSSAKRSTPRSRPRSTQWLASWRAAPERSSSLRIAVHVGAASLPDGAVAAADSGAAGRAAAAGLTAAALPRASAASAGRNASIRRSVISKPVRGSGASARSRLPKIAV